MPFAPINRIDQVIDDPQVRHLGLIVPVDEAHQGDRAVRPAIRFDKTQAASVRTAPLLDEHGPAIRDAMANGAHWPEQPMQPPSERSALSGTTST